MGARSRRIPRRLSGWCGVALGLVLVATVASPASGGTMAVARQQLPAGTVAVQQRPAAAHDAPSRVEHEKDKHHKHHKRRHHKPTLPVTTTTTTTTTSASGVAPPGTTVTAVAGPESNLCDSVQFDPVPPTTVPVGAYISEGLAGVNVTLHVVRVPLDSTFEPMPYAWDMMYATSPQTFSLTTDKTGSVYATVQLPVKGGPQGDDTYGVVIWGTAAVQGGTTSTSNYCELEVNHPGPPPPSAYHITLNCPSGAVKVNPVPLTGTISPLPQAGDELEAYISGEGSTSGSYVAGQSPVTLSSTSPGSFSVDVLVYGITSYNTSDVTAYIGYIPANSDGSPDYGGSPATVSNNCTFDLTGSTP